MIARIMNGIRTRVIGERGRMVDTVGTVKGKEAGASKLDNHIYLDTSTAAPGSVTMGMAIGVQDTVPMSHLNKSIEVPVGDVFNVVDVEDVKNLAMSMAVKLTMPLDLTDKNIDELVIALRHMFGEHLDEEVLRRVVILSMNYYAESVSNKIEQLISKMPEVDK